MRMSPLFCVLAVSVSSPLSAGTLSLVSLAGGSNNEIGVNTDGNPSLLEGDTRLATDGGLTLTPARVDTSATYETPPAGAVEEGPPAPQPPFQAGVSEGFADPTTGTTGMRVEAENEASDEAFISFATTELLFGFEYTGTEDLVLPTGWLSLTVDGSWGGDTFDYRVSSNAGLLAEVTTGDPVFISQTGNRVRGPRVDAVDGRANARFGAFFANAFTDLDGAEGSSVNADASGFAFTLLADGMTVKDGQFLSFSFGHNINSGVEGSSAFVDALSTASVSLNVLGLAEVDGGALGDIAWLGQAPSMPTDAAVIPLPAAGWLLLSGLAGLAAAGRRFKTTA